MPKRRKRKKTPRRIKENSIIAATAEDSPEVKTPDFKVIEPRLRKEARFLQLVGDARFVGAMRWMLRGCFACGSFVTFLFIFPNFGRIYESFTYQIASYVPQNFIPPDVYVPGALTMPFLLLLVAGFTAFGYEIGSTPPEIETGKDVRSPGEKIFELIFLTAICLSFIFFHLWSDSPDLGFIEIISHPVFIILAIIITSGISYYVYSRHRSQQLLFFVMYSAIAVAFVLFLIGMVIYILLKSFANALSN